MNTLKLVICVASLSFLSMNAQNPTFYTAERIDNSSASLNLKNINGYWHFSGPRSYEDNNLSIFWNNGSFQRYLTILDSGNVGIGTDTPESILQIGNSSIQNNANYLTFGKRVSTIEVNLPFIGHDALVDRNDLGLGTRSTGGGINFYTGNSSTAFSQNRVRMSIASDGNVGIGTTTPDAKLTVKGDIHTQEVKVDLSVPGPDYVFKEDYNLKSLEEVQNYIKAHGHLPNIPSAKEMEENGIQLGEMNMKLLEKIEELTLYVIELKDENSRMKSLEKELRIQKEDIEKLKRTIKNISK